MSNQMPAILTAEWALEARSQWKHNGPSTNTDACHLEILNESYGQQVSELAMVRTPTKMLVI